MTSGLRSKQMIHSSKLLGSGSAKESKNVLVSLTSTSDEEQPSSPEMTSKRELNLLEWS